MSTEDFMVDGRWQCRRCGACCHMAGAVWPEWNRGDGACIHLTEMNDCGIYPLRPDLCRTTKSVIQVPDESRAALCDAAREAYQ